MTAEGVIIGMLERRYGAVSMGARRFVTAAHVPDRTSWVTRRADFVAVDCYPASGLVIHGHEIKCSRSDWLRELADPTKADTFARHCDYWWLVVSDRAIVRPGELPEGWGLLAVAGRTVRRVVDAPRRTPEPMPRRMTVALLRTVQASRVSTPSPTPTFDPADDELCLDLDEIEARR